MKTKRILYVAAAFVLAVALLSGCAMLGPPETLSAAELLKRANAAATEAEKTQGKLPQAEAFTKAIKLYQRVDRKDKNSPEAAEALLNLGKIQAGIPIQDRPIGKIEQVYKTTAQNDYSARDTFLTVLQRFDAGRSLAQLEDAYGPGNARRIKAVVDQARVYQPWMARGIDDKNRGRFGYQFMSVLVGLTFRLPWFSYWFAMVLLALIVKIIITPLTKRQFKSMKEMQRLQPLIKQIQEKYKGDQREMGAKVMALYKEHGVNPLSGCLPILVQMPILFYVWSMIRLFEYQFTHGTFLWIGWGPLAHKWALPLMGRPVWLTAENLAQPDLILLILYTVSMILSQKISVVDPTQAEQQRMMMIMMPVMFFFLLGSLPSAFIFYWFIFNVLQTWQQYHIIHGGGPAAEVEAPAPAPEAAPRPRRGARRRRRR